MKKSFLERLGQERLYWDGGTGSVLQAKGLKGGELPERWNLTRPEDIVQLAVSYLEAGSDIVNSNTFGANRLHYPDPEDLKAVVQAGVRHVQEARRRTGRDDAFVALDIGPTGRLLKPMGDLDFEDAVSIFAEVMRYGAEAGADLILIETMSDSLEAKAAVLAAKENSDLPVCVTTIYDGKGKLLTGGTVQSVTAMMEGLRVDALGVNCGLGPRQMLPIVKELTEVCSLPVIVNPNAGLPRSENGKTVYDLTAEEFAAEMQEIAKLPVHVLGGCCGTTPEFIREEIRRTRDLPFAPPVKKHRAVVSSFSRAVEIGGAPVIIGERINPTGKKKFKEALRNNDIEYIVQQGIQQEDSGADMLDVNVGLPEIDEPAMMETVVTRLQGVLALPLQIDTTNAAALERGLRIYNGKAMINSVNGKQESMDAIFPLMKKYGGTAIALTLDENGIPDTVEGRVAIAKRIIDTAATYGIDKKDLIFDTLAMAVSADNNAAKVTLGSLNVIRHELGAHTSLGVSNISFGLPQRDIVNATFFALALENGLSAAIMNPFSAEMMKTYYAYRVLKGLDVNCTDYIAFADTVQNNITINEKSAGSKVDEQLSLHSAVTKGLKEPAAKLCKELLQTVDPLTIVNEHIIPALDEVGREYEQGRVYLPGLLMSAEAAKYAFEEIKATMSDSGGKTKCAFVIATVHGDIHDIGKNIVKLLLENYGFAVSDLGKDVAPEVIVEETVRLHAPLVGLSALMTTTVPAMEETIRQLRVAAPWAKIVVGGAVMTKEYADSIGADQYAKDAMDTVRYAETVNGEM